MDPLLLRFVVVAGLLVVVVVAGAAWRRRDGVVRTGRTLEDEDEARLDRGQLEAVGLDLSTADAGAVLIGSPTCSPCETVKSVLGQLAAERDGFRWVYADAAEHLDLARAHRVLRVPTLFVLAADGRIVARTSGVPRGDELREVLDRDLPVAA